MMQPAAETMDRERRERLVLTALIERRLVVEEEEARQLRARAVDLTRTEMELRDEVATLDAILGARVETPPASPPIQAAVPAATPAAAAPSPSTEETPKKKRRRKGSRMEEMLPKMREKFGSGTFDTEAVTDLIVQSEGGERRKAYFAAWSLLRDLAEEGAIEVAAEEGAGPRKKRIYRFKEHSANGAYQLEQRQEPFPGLAGDIFEYVRGKGSVRAEDLRLRFHEPPHDTLASALVHLEKRGDVQLIQGPDGVAVGQRIIARIDAEDRLKRTVDRNEAFVARVVEARRRDLERSHGRTAGEPE